MLATAIGKVPLAAGASSFAVPPSTMNYNYGGLIQVHPRVYLVFWGSGWNGDTSGVKAAEQSLFQGLANTSYNGILSQYTDSSGRYIHNDVALAGVWTDGATPPYGIGKSALAGEADNAARQNNWTTDSDTQFIILPQSTSTYDSSMSGNCAYHNYGNVSGKTYVYSVIPFLNDPQFKSGCFAGGSVTRAMTVVTTHEYAESATDPVLNAWIGANEMADICNLQPYALGSNYDAQYLYSLTSNTCSAATESGPKVTRLSGADRVASAIYYSQAAFPYRLGGQVVITGSADPGWVDAVPALSLYGKNTDLLYADSSSSNCSSADANALVNEVYRVQQPGLLLFIVDSNNAVPTCVDRALSGAYSVVRLPAMERCASSVLVAGDDGISAQYVNVVSGNNFPDAISMSALAYNSPTLIAPYSSSGTASSLCSAADTYLKAFGNNRRSAGHTPIVRIAGGTAAVSTAVQNEITSDICGTSTNCAVLRFAGADRYQTSESIAINQVGNSPTNGNPPEFVAATGLNWPDGVSGGAQAARLGTAMLLYDGESTVQPYVSAYENTSSTGYVLGGTAAETVSNVSAFANWFPPVPLGGPIVAGIGSNLCVDDSGSGTTNGNPVQIWGCNSTGAQSWTLESDGEIVGLGGCLTVPNNATAIGTYVVWSTCNGSAGQQWQNYFEDNSLYNPNSGRCLDDPYSTTNPGTQLWIWDCDNTNAQRWRLP